MRKFLFICSLILIFSCEDDGTTEFCDIINDQTINLANPEFINLQVPAGWSYANGGTKGIVIYRFGNSYRAFSRECPIQACVNKMIVVNDIKLQCPCDDAEFSILDGSPQTAGVSKSVCEFKVNQLSSSVLNVTNF
jgi:nitrite reductase/ring-hydroxylating ferredoxin subunit